MKESVKKIGQQLKKARLAKKLSQRAFSLKIGLPQGHISKIENGQVDLQASSLIECARALELELMLVPQVLVPAIQALQRNLTTAEQIPAYQLEPDDE